MPYFYFMKKVGRFIRKCIELGFLFLIVAFLTSLIADEMVSSNAESYLIDQVDSIEDPFEVALVLGCSGSFDTKYTNPYFRYRMEACAKLYKEGKVKKFLLSGDNSRKGYNEPEEMKKALIKLGVPEKNIYLDFAGFRTLDSVVRSNKVFGQNKILVVSQKFHNERAIFIANNKGVAAYGFNAKDVTGRLNRDTSFREYLARVKAVLDLYILKTEPKFLGEQVEI